MNSKQVEEIVNAVTESTKQILVKEIVREMMVSTARAPRGYHNAFTFTAEQLCEKYLGHDFSIWRARVAILDKREEVAVCAVCQTVNHMLRRYTEEDGSWEVIDHTGVRNTVVSRSEPIVV